MRTQLLGPRLGIALLALGAFLNVFGLTQLSPEVGGVYVNRSVDAADDVAVAGTVAGKAWLVCGTTLMAAGGVVLLRGR